MITPPPPRVIFVNRFYWPDQPATAQLLTDLAESLAARGLSVVIVTSHPGGATVPAIETHHGVEIIRVGGERLGQKNLLKRAADFGRFLLCARRAVARHAHAGDTLVAMTDPPLLGTALAGVAKRKQLRLIHWVQDVFPEVAMAIGHRFTVLARPARDRAWRSAHACVVLGSDMASILRERRVPASQIHISPNWAPEGLHAMPADSASALRARWSLTGKFAVAYSGNLGRVHDFSAIIPLAEFLRADTNIAFVFIGDGAQRPALESAARARDLFNIHFHPAQPREQLADTLALGDVHLVTLRSGCERLVFPSKLYGIAAIGRPVIFVGPRDCEVARVIETNRFGHAFTSHADEIPRIAATLRSLMTDSAQCHALGEAASAFCAREGRLHHATTHWYALLMGKPLADSPGASSL
jgi:colanic acid biosynthesis glycosyl transferase WcaI